MTGRAEVPAGTYTVTLTVTNTHGVRRSAETELDVAPEDAAVSLDPANPAKVLGSLTGANGQFELRALAQERTPDQAGNQVAGRR